MNPTLRSSAAHVFVDDIAAPVLSDGDRHHLERVLRLHDGDAVTVSDGCGAWRSGVFRRGGDVEPTGAVERVERGEELTIACAIPKGDRVELVVQKVSELGIDRIVLFESARSVVRWTGERRVAQVERLGRIAREAASQSRRVVLPVVSWATREAVFGLDGMVMAEPDASRRLGAGDRGVIIGPEGGFDQDELRVDLPRVALAPTILRVETAAVVAAAGLVAWRF